MERKGTGFLHKEDVQNLVGGDHDEPPDEKVLCPNSHGFPRFPNFLRYVFARQVCGPEQKAVSFETSAQACLDSFGVGPNGLVLRATLS